MQVQEAEGVTALLMAFVSAERDLKGIKRCRKLVNGARRALGMDVRAVPFAPTNTNRVARELLVAYCLRCQKCELGKRPQIMHSPPD